MTELTSRQRACLGKYAHELKPIVFIGQKGMSESLEDKTESSLVSHELIKIKFIDYKDRKREFAELLAERCNAAIVQIIGNIVVLYRPFEKEECRKYHI